MKKGAIYIRVSTEEQAREGYSLDAQLKQIMDYAQKNNILINDDYIFKDEGISGRKAEKRPGFMEMIKQAKSKPKKFDVILVHKFDRFSRNREDSVVYKSLLKKEYGISVISVCEPIDSDDKMSVIIEAFLEAMAEYYSLNLSAEVKKGQKEKHSRGELQTRPSYGYDVKNNTLIPNEIEKNVVKIIFEEYGINNITIMKITKKLNELGFKTKNGNKFENRNVYYILNNPVYIGKLKYTPGRRNSYNFDDPNTILVNGNHKAIISIDLWNKCQKKIKLNKKLQVQHKEINNQPKHWLKGLIRCKICGCTMVTNNKTNLRCNGYNKGKCNNKKLIKINETCNLIIDIIKSNIKNKTIDNIVLSKKKRKTNDKHALIINQLNKLDEKEIRIKDAYINGIDSIEEYRKNKNIIFNEKKILTKELNKIGMTNENNNKIRIIENDKKIYEILQDENISIKEKNEIAHILINKIEFDSDNNTLELYYN